MDFKSTQIKVDPKPTRITCELIQNERDGFEICINPNELPIDLVLSISNPSTQTHLSQHSYKERLQSECVDRCYEVD